MDSWERRYSDAGSASGRRDSGNDADKSHTILVRSSLIIIKFVGVG